MCAFSEIPARKRAKAKSGQAECRDYFRLVGRAAALSAERGVRSRWRVAFSRTSCNVSQQQHSRRLKLIDAESSQKVGSDEDVAP